MASIVKRAREFLPSKHHAGRTSPIGEATGSSMTTVDQTDMRALVSYVPDVRDETMRDLVRTREMSPPI